MPVTVHSSGVLDKQHDCPLVDAKTAATLTWSVTAHGQILPWNSCRRSWRTASMVQGAANCMSISLI